MENENVGEQPVLESEGMQDGQEKGSPFGKFANAQELKTAYENLEKEFTRKSQLLSSFQKEASSFQNENATTFVEEQHEPKTVEETLDVVTDETFDLVENVPYWEREDWSRQVQDFLEQNPLAKNYAEQISQTVLEDKEILNSKNPLQRAWAKWLEKNFRKKTHETGDGRVHFFYDSTAEYFYSVLPKEELHRVFHQYNSQLQDEDRKQLSETTEALIRTNFNLTEAAKLLYVHKNTMLYRYNKMRNLLDIDPIRNSSDRTFLILLYQNLQ